MIRMIAKARFSSGTEGNLRPREEFWATPERAQVLQGLGVAVPLESYETKPANFNLQTKPGPSASLPEAPASPKPTSTVAGDVPASLSTTPTGSRRGQQPSTPATDSGGESTPIVSDKLSVAPSGPKTRKPRKRSG